MTLCRLIPSVLVALSVQAAADLHPVDLRCDGQSDWAVVRATPELSWRVESASRGQVQSAWQILVANNPRTLAEDKGDLWDSGKVAASRSPFVRYAGKPLAAGQRCHWKVRCWGPEGQPSGWSAPAFWEVAPQSPTDWQGARWINDGRANPSRDEDFYQPDPAPLLRREFTFAKPVVRARLHVAGLGLCYASLNGERLADQFLDPPWTAFDKRILFRTLDVTAQVAQGTNCLGLTLGNGWYHPLPLRMWGQRNIRGSLATGRPRVIACLVAEHPDGTRTTITTGPGWTTAAGPTQRNSIYLGEVHDARRALPGWDRAGFDASQWQPVRVTDDALEPLQPLAMPPVRAETPIAALAVTTPSPGVHIVDFGRNFTGIPEVDLKVPAGTQVKFRFGEVLNKDGTLNPLTSVCGQIKGKRKGPDGSEISVGGRGAPAIAWQQDVFIARGGGLEKYRPDFTFHGFRFMEITGLPEPPAAVACRGIPLHTDLPDAGTFACSDERLNRIQEMCRRTFLANVVSVQSDCPHRERFGYGGDIVATSEAFLMNFDMGGFYAKTVRDWADAARPDGRFTDTAPFVGIDYCGVGWAMVHPLLLEQLHQHYGNRSLIEEQLPAALRWLDGEAGRRKQGLVTSGLGDHEALAKAGGPVLTTPMFIDSARRVARLARLTGRNDEAARFEAMADESAAAWATAFLDSPTGKVGGGSQSEQAMTLGFGGAPNASQPAIFARLVESLGAANDGPRLSTGIFGTRFLLEELSRNGRSDIALALAKRNTFPSWGWMLENGATTLWEHWAGSDNTYSHNHPMFGSISAWFFRWLGGIQPAADAVGFDRIEIRPQVVSGLKWVKCSHRSIRGRIESNWSTTDTGVSFEFVIPPDTTAILELPAGAADELTEGGRAVTEVAGIKQLSSGPAVRRLQVGGGRYQFSLRRNRANTDDAKGGRTSAATSGFVWPSAIPADCPFPRSTNLTGIHFTGRHSDYRLADTWYPSWASDGNLYSPFTDGQVDGVSSGSGKGDNAQTGHAVMIGDDPLHLIISNTSLPKVASALPYRGRYPCGSLVKDGIWYYGTYCLGPAGTHKHRGFDWNWPNLGPMPGFQISRDLGRTWSDSPLSPDKPLFPEPATLLGPVKMGAPHFVDFGKNMEHSPDGKAYVLGMGAEENDPKPRPCIKPGPPGVPFLPNPECTDDFAHANLSWISADQVYLARVKPSPETINDIKAYEFFAGHDANGKPVWTSDFARIKPLIEWNNHMGCVTATYVPGLKKYLMCVTDGWPTVAKMTSYILEADVLTGPWKMVAYLKDFGEQAYFLNFPSKFISADGRTFWLCYSANFSPGWNGVELKFNPPGGRYGLCLHEVILLGPSEGSPPAAAPAPRSTK